MDKKGKIMAWYILPLVIFSGISMYVGIYHFWTYIKRRQGLENLSFALMSFSMVLWYIFAAEAYSAPTIEGSAYWYKILYLVLPLFASLFIFFGYHITERKTTKVPYILTAMNLLFGAILWFVPEEYSFSSTGTEPIIVDWMNLVYNDPNMGPLVDIYFLYLLFCMGFISYLLISAYRKGKTYILPAIASIFVFFLCAINDMLVSSRVYPFMYLLEYAFLGIIINMAYTLLNKFVGLYATVEVQAAHQIELNKAFRRFVPHEFISYLNKDNITEVKLGDQVEKEMTVLFSDIRSFTALSETMNAEENFNFINSYLKRVGPVIRQNNGFIDKYIGDAIMALFPNSVDDAVLAAIEMRKALEIYNHDRKESGYQPIDVGIGIHTGVLMLGTIGEQERMEGTVISDAVNQAARLEGATKKVHAPVIISRECIDKIQNKEEFNTRYLGKVKVPGKTEKLTLYEVYNADPDELRQYKNDTKAEFEKAVSYIQSGKKGEGHKILRKIQKPDLPDKTLQLYLSKTPE